MFTCLLVFAHIFEAVPPSAERADARAAPHANAGRTRRARPLRRGGGRARAAGGPARGGRHRQPARGRHRRQQPLQHATHGVRRGVHVRRCAPHPLLSCWKGRQRRSPSGFLCTCCPCHGGHTPWCHRPALHASSAHELWFAGVRTIRITKSPSRSVHSTKHVLRGRLQVASTGSWARAPPGCPKPARWRATCGRCAAAAPPASKEHAHHHCACRNQGQTPAAELLRCMIRASPLLACRTCPAVAAASRQVREHIRRPSSAARCEGHSVCDDQALADNGGAIAVACGSTFSLALTASGRVVVWGGIAGCKPPPGARRWAKQQS